MFDRKPRMKFTARDAQDLVRQYQPPLECILSTIKEAAINGEVFIMLLKLDEAVAKDLRDLGFKISYRNPTCVTVSWAGIRA